MLVKQRRLGRRMRGFTLIELVTAITLLAILAGLAVPAFQGFIANQRIRNTSFDLMAALMRARSEAVTRNGNVSFSKTGTGWGAGWAVKSGTDTLLSQDEVRNLSITDSANLAEIVYGKDGRTSTASTRFTIAPSTAINGVTSRCVSVGPSGVPSSRVGACS